MNRVGQSIDIGFDDFADWRNAVLGVKVNGVAASAAQYVVSPGKITLNGALFPEAGSYEISVEAKGFANAAIQQAIVTNSNVNLALRKPTLTSANPKQPGKMPLTETSRRDGSPTSETRST